MRCPGVSGGVDGVGGPAIDGELQQPSGPVICTRRRNTHHFEKVLTKKPLLVNLRPLCAFAVVMIYLDFSVSQ